MTYLNRGRKKRHTENVLYPAPKILAVAVTLCLILSLFSRPLPACASAPEPPDITGDKKYSISVMMVYDDKTVEGGSFEAYRVGEIVRLKTSSKTADGTSTEDTALGGEAYRFWPTASLVKSMGFGQEEIDAINRIDKDKPDAENRLNAILDEKLNEIETAAQKEKLAKELAAYVGKQAGTGGGTGTESSDPEPPDLWGDDHAAEGNVNGVAAFENLRTGLYLFTQSAEQASPGYYPVEPFLVSVPVYDSEYNYKVQAFPNDYEVKIYVKFRLMAIEPDPPDPPRPKPGPDPKPGPSPALDPVPEPQVEQWVREYLAEPDADREPEPQPRLPQTGQINWPVPVLLVGGGVLLLSGLLLRQWGKNGQCRKKERKQEVSSERQARS